MKCVLVIINPVSGTLSKQGVEDIVSRRLLPRGMKPDFVYTQYPGHADSLARGAVLNGYYAVIVAGGDGTVNEVGAALRNTGVPMGILPFGSGNGLERHLNMSIDLDKALDVIADDNVMSCDCGTANGVPFFCTFGMGFDASVSREFAEMGRRGLYSYVLSAIREYLNYSPREYTICHGNDSLSLKAFMVAVCNASQYGNNAFVAPSASIRDGLLDITVVHTGNPLTRAFAGVELFTGRFDKNLLIETMRVDKAVITRSGGPAHVDGDPGNFPLTVEVECHPNEILLFVDKNRPAFRPFITPLESFTTDAKYLFRENMKNLGKKAEKFIQDIIPGKGE
ncbi:MAG: diacylglycerol kinase family lipid kinase [Candidatus Amulumruptor caecigallinarius]|nr:diacylglycerol kinase family lipid kinase [Candidatus Amulumruptor caecigallinarius]